LKFLFSDRVISVILFSGFIFFSVSVELYFGLLILGFDVGLLLFGRPIQNTNNAIPKINSDSPTLIPKMRKALISASREKAFPYCDSASML